MSAHNVAEEVVLDPLEYELVAISTEIIVVNTN